MNPLSSHTHLERRGSVYYFRFPYPKKVRDYFAPQKEWKGSLKTKDREEAVRALHIKALEFDSRIEEAQENIRRGYLSWHDLPAMPSAVDGEEGCNGAGKTATRSNSAQAPATPSLGGEDRSHQGDGDRLLLLPSEVLSSLSHLHQRLRMAAFDALAFSPKSQATLNEEQQELDSLKALYTTKGRHPKENLLDPAELHQRTPSPFGMSNAQREAARARAELFLHAFPSLSSRFLSGAPMAPSSPPMDEETRRQVVALLTPEAGGGHILYAFLSSLFQHVGTDNSNAANILNSGEALAAYLEQNYPALFRQLCFTVFAAEYDCQRAILDKLEGKTTQTPSFLFSPEKGPFQRAGIRTAWTEDKCKPYSSGGNEITLTGLLQKYLKERQPTDKTAKDITSYTRRFIAFCGGDILLSEVTKKHIRDYKDMLLRGVAPVLAGHHS